MELLRRNQFLRLLLLRIYARVSFPKLSEEGGVQCGVWETTVEQRVGDGDMGRPPNLKISENAIARGWCRGRRRVIKTFVNRHKVDTEA